MVLRLLHPLLPNSVVERTAKGLRRQRPVANRIRDTIWSIDDLLAHIRDAYPSNETLTRKELLHKTMILIMIFAASRPVEIARMETPSPGDVGQVEARLRAIAKQRGTERTSVIIHKVSIRALCPLEALKEWLRRRGDVASPHLFTLEVRAAVPAAHTRAVGRGPDGAAPIPNQRALPGQPGVTPFHISTTPRTTAKRTLYKDLTSTYVRTAFKAIMLAAGIPDRYAPYSIRHAVVTALYQRGASDEEVGAYGRWAPGSRVPRLFYFIHATDGSWIGEKLLAEQPSLKEETQHELEESEGAEGQEEQSEADSAGAGDPDGCAELLRSAVLHDSDDREGHGLDQHSHTPPSSRFSPTW
jgi:integrase